MPHAGRAPPGELESAGPYRLGIGVEGAPVSSGRRRRPAPLLRHRPGLGSGMRRRTGCSGGLRGDLAPGQCRRHTTPGPRHGDADPAWPAWIRSRQGNPCVSDPSDQPRPRSCMRNLPRYCPMRQRRQYDRTHCNFLRLPPLFFVPLCGLGRPSGWMPRVSRKGARRAAAGGPPSLSRALRLPVRRVSSPSSTDDGLKSRLAGTRPRPWMGRARGSAWSIRTGSRGGPTAVRGAGAPLAIQQPCKELPPNAS